AVSTGGGILCVALALYAVSLHQLGYTLVLAFFYPLILRGPAEWLKPRNWLYPVTAGAIVAAFFFYWSGTIGRYMERPMRMEGQGPPVPPETVEAGGSVLASRAPLLDNLVDTSLPIAIAMAAVLLLAAGWLARSRVRPLPERLLLLAVAACCALQLFNLALIALLGLAFAKREGLGAIRRPDVVFAAGLIGVTFLLWIGLVAVVGLAPDDPTQGPTGLKGTIRSMLNYPHFFVFWGYAREWPLMSIVAV